MRALFFSDFFFRKKTNAKRSDATRRMQRAAATSVLYSKTFLVVYFVNVFVNHMLLVWLLVATVSRDYETLTGLWMFVFEVVTTTFLLFETCVRGVSVGARSFFLHQSNVYDVGVLALSVVVLVGAKTAPLLVSGWSDVASAAVVCARFFVQQLRLIAVIKNQYRNFNSQSRVSIFLEVDSGTGTAALPPSPQPPGGLPTSQLLSLPKSPVESAEQPLLPHTEADEDPNPFSDSSSDESSDEGPTTAAILARKPLKPKMGGF
jgi:hypothetical protein